MTTIRGVELSYDRSGTGPSFVWGHGLRSSRQNEDDAGLIDWPIVRRSADVLRYDARGHGRSAFTADPEDYGWDQLALDQLSLCDHLEIRQAVVGGASMGAATALHVATVSPERVRCLVLMIPPTAWETRADQTDLYRQMAAVVESSGVEPLIAAGADLPPSRPLSRCSWPLERAAGRNTAGCRPDSPCRSVPRRRCCRSADAGGRGRHQLPDLDPGLVR